MTLDQSSNTTAMSLDIRPLARRRDAAVLLELFSRAGDYFQLEQGAPPTRRTVASFFTETPPDHDLDATAKLGLFGGDRLIGVADMALGHPATTDAYIGFLLIDPGHRGQGLGRSFLERLIESAWSRGCNRIFIAVLDGNPRARAFWEREGFVLHETLPPRRLGKATHLLHRMVRAL